MKELLCIGVLFVLFSFHLSSQVSCEDCNDDQLQLAKHLLKDDRINLERYQNVDVNFEFKHQYQTLTLFKVKVTNRRYYTPFSLLAQREFDIDENQLAIFIPKVDFDQGKNYIALLNTTEKSYDRSPEIPIRLEPYLPEYYANALFISSLLDFQDTIVQYFISKGYLDRKYVNKDVGVHVPDSPTNSSIQDGRKFNFEFENQALKDSSILEMYFRNLHDHYQRQLYSIDKSLNQHAKGFADIVHILDSLQYKHYPKSIQRNNETINSLFLKLQQYYVPASKMNSLKNCLLAENCFLTKTAFEMGNNEIFNRVIKGTVVDTVFFIDRYILHLTTDEESFLIHISYDSTVNFIQTNKIDYCPSHLGNLFAVPVGNDILIADRKDDFQVVHTFENSSIGTFLEKPWYFRSSYLYNKKPDYIIVDKENGSYLYDTDGWVLLDSISNNIAGLDWKHYFSEYHMALYKSNGKNTVYEVGEKQILKYEFKINIDHFTHNYFLIYNSRCGKQGLMMMSNGKLKRILPRKFDRIEVESTYLNREPVLYFYGTKKGKKIKFNKNGKKYL